MIVDNRMLDTAYNATKVVIITTTTTTARGVAIIFFSRGAKPGDNWGVQGTFGSEAPSHSKKKFRFWTSNIDKPLRVATPLS